MMNFIWFALLLLAVVFGFATGHIQAVSQAALSGSVDAVTLFLLLLGGICLWNGLMKIAEACGITRLLARALAPVLRRLFPDLPADGAGMRYICMNLAANFLGLGNAATPLGLLAMKDMARRAPKGVATDSMALFIVMNTASLQLIPTNLALLRLRAGARSPFDILPCVWLSSIVTLLCGIVFARLMERAPERRLSAHPG